MGRTGVMIVYILHEGWNGYDCQDDDDNSFFWQHCY